MQERMRSVTTSYRYLGAGSKQVGAFPFTPVNPFCSCASASSRHHTVGLDLACSWTAVELGEIQDPCIHKHVWQGCNFLKARTDVQYSYTMSCAVLDYCVLYKYHSES